MPRPDAIADDLENFHRDLIVDDDALANLAAENEHDSPSLWCVSFSPRSRPRPGGTTDRPAMSEFLPYSSKFCAIAGLHIDWVRQAIWRSPPCTADAELNNRPVVFCTTPRSSLLHGRRSAIRHTTGRRPLSLFREQLVSAGICASRVPHMIASQCASVELLYLAGVYFGRVADEISQRLNAVFLERMWGGGLHFTASPANLP